ncbi:MAG: oxygen-independent coproporphyrinogen III oxidase [SAR202 cluster bacterium]|nr:oxygen-independent coproporphyrinogen III oxidase [SAR202 cluster bacterium]
MKAIKTSLVPDFTQDPKLLEQFGENGPYYTSYPTHGDWSNQLGHTDYVKSLKDFFLKNGDAPVHLYIHIPFCAKLCFYCICNIIVTNNRDRMQHFVDYLFREIDLLNNLFSEIGTRPNIKEIHLGGGTPSHLEDEQLEQLVNKLGEIADLKNIYEFAMEIDPRTTSRENLKFYSTLGINRISFGVQDFDSNVQEAINRVQPVEMVEDLLSPDVRACFDGFNFDLLYGLPRQTRKTFENTVDLVKKLAPERITLIKYAHAPELRKHMRLIDAKTLPPTDEMPLMFNDSVQSLTADGYVWVGIGDFAKPSDEMAKAVNEKRAWRDLGGFATGNARNMIGIGPTAGGAIGDAYFQNAYGINEYYKAIDEGQFPIHSGFIMDGDDVLRREVIFRIICDSSLDYEQIETKFAPILSGSFENYFSNELASLARFEEDGILEFNASINRGFSLTPTGRFFGRHVARVFDRFLQRAEGAYEISGP